MSPWTSESVALALGVPTPGRLAFTDVTTDTRHLKPGALFVALKGDRFDAHDFLADARTRHFRTERNPPFGCGRRTAARLFVSRRGGQQDQQ